MSSRENFVVDLPQLLRMEGGAYVRFVSPWFVYRTIISGKLSPSDPDTRYGG